MYRGSIQAKEGQRKQNHPELYCAAQKCLWFIAKLDHVTQTYSRDPRYPTGYCPRHQHLAPKEAK